MPFRKTSRKNRRTVSSLVPKRSLIRGYCRTRLISWRISVEVAKSNFWVIHSSIRRAERDSFPKMPLTMMLVSMTARSLGANFHSLVSSLAAHGRHGIVDEAVDLVVRVLGR